ncbi:MAG: hypothetical protein IKB20_02355, partial [Clostridia bacterium]|nr:hypothetical protein [Clostridia bacterium]
MKKKWLALLLILTLTFTATAVISACDDTGDSSIQSSFSQMTKNSSIEDTSSIEDSSNEEVTTPTESLAFQKIAGKEEYRVVGLGTVSDLDIVIPSTYKGLPVTEIC